jgi:hypothetical protein
MTWRSRNSKVAIDEIVVRRLLSTLLPELAGPPMQPVRPQGTDNIVYRLGSELSVRLPRKLSAVPSLLIGRVRDRLHQVRSQPRSDFTPDRSGRPTGGARTDSCLLPLDR